MMISSVRGEADLATIKKVRRYDRRLGNRSRVLEEVVRLHRVRRATQPASAALAYQSMSATSGPSQRRAQRMQKRGAP
jgi:hypothetical protein